MLFVTANVIFKYVSGRDVEYTISCMDCGPRGTSNFWFERMCACQGSILVNIDTTVFELPQIVLAAIQPANRGTTVCESSDSGMCRAALRLRAHQVRPRRETEKSKERAVL